MVSRKVSRKKLTHVDSAGRARMVDVSEKPATLREAVAQGSVMMNPSTIKAVREKSVAKGDVLAVARIAGIMAAKKTAGLIPLCHPLPIHSVQVDLTVDERNRMLTIESRVKTIGQTGVEMEALTAVAVSALTVYDMCKSLDKGMTISDIVLLEKRGGKSGEYRRRKQ